MKKANNGGLPSTFEEAIRELESIIKELEEGNVSLDRSLKLLNAESA